MLRLSREARIGLFLGGTLFILAAFIFVVGDMSRLFRRPGYPLLTSFDSALGVEPHTVVRMAGVKIGYVKNIRLVRHRALITMMIFPSVEVPRGSKAALASLGLLGEKYIEIFPGEGAERCQPGEELSSLPSVSFDQLGLLLVSIGDEIKEMSRSLRSLLGPQERENLSSALKNMAAVSQDLRYFLETNREEMSEGVVGFSRATSQISEDARRLARELEAAASSLQQFLETNREEVTRSLSRLQELSEQASQTLQGIDRLLQRLDRGEGTVGRLLQDPALYEETKRAATRISGVTERVASLSFSAGLRSDYLAAENQVRGQLSLSLWPQGARGRSSFSLAVVRDPREGGFLWSIQGGWRAGRIVARGGLIESELGAAVDVEAISDRLLFSLESFAFNREEGPKLRLFSRYLFYKNFYLVLGIDDFGVARRRSLILGLGAGRS